MPSSSKPKVDFEWINQRGEKALQLATEHRPEVEPRLSPGVIDNLTEDLGALGAKVAAPKTAVIAAKAATAGQNGALAVATLLITGITGSVRRKNATAEQRKAYGVGARLNAKVVSSVVSVGSAIIERASENPDEARGLGILATDIEKLKEQIAIVGNVDEKQTRLIAAKPLTTRERNRTANRVYAAIKEIAGAGVLAFALDEARRAEFDALDDLPKAKKGPTPK